MREGQVVVAVHDVSTATLGESRWVIERLATMGARPLVIKVVPFPPSDGLAELVRSEQERGSQIVLHGLTHRVVGPLRGPLALRLRGALFAPRDAEMISVPAADLASRIRAGLDLLRGLGAACDAFCAPSWLSPPGIAAALRGAGIRYQIGMASVTDLGSGRVRWLLPLGYMGTGGPQESLAVLLGGAVLALGPAARAVKVFVHPQGVRSSRDARRALLAIRRLVRDRRVVTYAEACGRA